HSDDVGQKATGAYLPARVARRSAVRVRCADRSSARGRGGVERNGQRDRVMSDIDDAGSDTREGGSDIREGGSDTDDGGSDIREGGSDTDDGGSDIREGGSDSTSER